MSKCKFTSRLCSYFVLQVLCSTMFFKRHVRRKLCTPPPPCYHVVLLYFISYFSLQFFNQVIRYSMSRRNVRPNLHPYSSRVFQISNLPVKNFNRGGTCKGSALYRWPTTLHSTGDLPFTSRTFLCKTNQSIHNVFNSEPRHRTIMWWHASLHPLITEWPTAALRQSCDRRFAFWHDNYDVSVFVNHVILL